MDADLLLLIPVAVLGGLFGLDVVSFPQAMISRPLVAATASGALLGYPGRGLVIGIALEFIALEALPFGASRYPEWGSAAVVGGAVFATTPDGTPSAMSFAAVAALVTAWVGGWSMVLLRRWNARWAKRQQEGIARGSGGTVVGLQLAGMTADLLRGGLLTFLSLAGFLALRSETIHRLVMTNTMSRAVVVSTASAVGLAAIWKVVHSTSGARWLLAGGLAIGFGLAAGLL